MTITCHIRKICERSRQGRDKKSLHKTIFRVYSPGISPPLLLKERYEVSRINSTWGHNFLSNCSPFTFEKLYIWRTYGPSMGTLLIKRFSTETQVHIYGRSWLWFCLSTSLSAVQHLSTSPFRHSFPFQTIHLTWKKQLFSKVTKSQ